MRIFYFIFLFIGIQLSAQKKPNLNFKQNKFKILQFTDLHYNQDLKESEVVIINLENALEEEKPDLVVFTGDNVTAKTVKQGWDNILETAIKRQIPWAVVFGNHDDEYDWSRKQIMDYITAKPFCYAEEGPKNIKGVGNYLLKIHSGDKPSAILYFMDSNTYSEIEGVEGYGWFTKDQIKWYSEESNKLKKKNSDIPYPALAFFHIPLNEYVELVSKEGTIIGTKKERECPGGINSGMFMAMKQSGDIMGVFTGHDHDNDYIGNHQGIYLAYGRFSGGKNTYTNLDLNGCRVIILQEGTREFDSYIRLQDGQKLHHVNYPNTFKKQKK